MLQIVICRLKPKVEDKRNRSALQKKELRKHIRLLKKKV